MVGISNTVIDPNVELLLIVRLVVDAPVIVGGARVGRERIPPQKCKRDRIHSIDGNYTAAKRAAAESCSGQWAGRRRVVDRRGPSVDRLGEDALSLEFG